MSKKTVFLSTASGILLFLSFPKVDISATAFFALVPLFFALRKTSVRGGFAAGAVAGFFCNVGVMYWIAYVVVKYGYLPFYVGIAAMLAMAIALSLYTAVFAAGQAYFISRGMPVALTAPFLWTCVEYGKSHLLTGFPWENLAYSQHQNIALLQISDITGTYGVTFLIVLINAVLYDLLNLRKRKKTIVTAEILLAAVMTISVLLYGYQRIETFRTSSEGNPAQEIMVVQGNVDQSIKWDPLYQKETLSIYQDLSQENAPHHAGLIVWPETAAPFFFQDVNDQHRQVVDIARSTGSYLLFGSPSYLIDGGKEHIMNSAFLLTPEGSIAGRYDKVHLVPFGEYVPMRSIMPFMGKIVVGVGDFLPGRGFDPLEMNKEKIGTLICYEGIFPEIASEYRRKGARLLVNITNDAWFGRTSAPYQHLSMVTLRAIENRVFIVRAANTGISAIIAPTGEIVAKTELFKKTTLRGKIRLTDGQTFYSKFGDVFAYGCFAVLVIFLSITCVRRKEK
jgi:apolipoprotein N-acyltransferase